MNSKKKITRTSAAASRASSTSTEYAQPYRPVIVKGYNTIANITFKRSLQSLTIDQLLNAAQKAEKYTCFGDDNFIPPLEILIASIKKEAQLTPFGLFVTKQRLLNILKNRLRVARLLAHNPEIRDVSLPRPILITGLQRTGTTLLHRLLSADTNHRALLSYEALNPAPLHQNPDLDRRKKIKVAITSQKALAYLAPDFFAVHPVEAMAPEEDVLLLDYAFLSTVAESTLRVPGYANWVEKTDNQAAYEYMKLLLKVLSWQHPQKTWILKSPHHLEFLDTFLNTFPGTTVVMTHRDPVDTLPSFCSMMAHGRGIFSDIVNTKEIGAHWLRKTARMLQRGHQTRTRRNTETFVDIQYSELTQHPMAQLQRIYTAAKRPLSDDTTDQLKIALQKNRQYKYGIHQYSMEPFGLTKSNIYNTYGSYIDNYIHGKRNQ